MSGTLVFRNRQRTRAVDRGRLRQITLALLQDHLQAEDWELCIHLVAAREMTRLNGRFLQHEGSTDVITFDYAGPAARVTAHPFLHGEIFVCLDDAVAQARQFRTTWQGEAVRYLIHGLLHLCGHDDLQPAARRVMKREENRLLGCVSRRFALCKLDRRSSVQA